MRRRAMVEAGTTVIVTDTVIEKFLQRSDLIRDMTVRCLQRSHLRIGSRITLSDLPVLNGVTKTFTGSRTGSKTWRKGTQSSRRSSRSRERRSRRLTETIVQADQTQESPKNLVAQKDQERLVTEKQILLLKRKKKLE